MAKDKETLTNNFGAPLDDDQKKLRVSDLHI